MITLASIVQRIGQDSSKVFMQVRFLLDALFVCGSGGSVVASSCDGMTLPSIGWMGESITL